MESRRGYDSPEEGWAGLYCIRLCNQMEVRNLHAYVVVAVVDMITIVARVKSPCDTILRLRGECRSEPGFALAEVIGTDQG